MFFSPGKLMDGLAVRPAWGGALLVGAFLMMAAAWLTPAKLTIAAARQQILEGGGTVPPNLELMADVFRWFGIIGGPVVWFIIVPVMAAITAIIFLFVFGEEGSFRQYMAITAHGFLIPAVSVLLLLPLQIATQNAQLRFSLATFTPFLGDGYLAGVLSVLDLFGLWAWVAVALGVSKITRKQSWKSATMVLMVIPVGFAAVIGIFV